MINKKVKKEKIITILHNNSEIKDEKIIADLFNEYYSNITIQIRETLNQTARKMNEFLIGNYPNTMYFDKTDIEEVGKIIDDLKENKSAGNDEIAPKILKKCKNEIKGIITIIINDIIEKEQIPNELKNTQIIPVYKKGDTKNLNNYRPISITNIIAKILEKIIYNRLTNYLEKNNIIDEKQFGFKKGGSTENALLKTIHTIQKELNNKKIVVVIFYDLTKAFDMIEKN